MWGEERYTLCLTLGALAELEDAFGVQDLNALAERFGSGRLSSRDLLTILGLGLRGGGHAISDREVGKPRACATASSRWPRPIVALAGEHLRGARPECCAGLSRQTLRRRRTHERARCLLARALPVGRRDGVWASAFCGGARRILARDAARTHRRLARAHRPADSARPPGGTISRA